MGMLPSDCRCLSGNESAMFLVGTHAVVGQKGKTIITLVLTQPDWRAASNVKTR